jgi:hypothetical protein
MSDKELRRLQQQVDYLTQLVKPLCDLLIYADDVTKARGLNKNTISQNDKLEKYNKPGERKLLISIASVPVIRNRKRIKVK